MWIFLLAAAILALVLFYHGATWLGWVLPVVVLHIGWWRAGFAPSLFVTSAAVFGLAALIGGVVPLRRQFTRLALPLIKPMLPRMSETERIAIEWRHRECSDRDHLSNHRCTTGALETGWAKMRHHWRHRSGRRQRLLRAGYNRHMGRQH